MENKEENKNEKIQNEETNTIENKIEEVKSEETPTADVESVKEEKEEAQAKIEEKSEETDKKEVKEAEKENKKPKKEKVKKEKKQKEKNKSDVKLRERFSLNIRKKWLVNGMRTVLLVLIVFLAYIALNLGMSALKLPEIDVTKSQVYSISEESKAALEKVNQDVKIYVYGFDEDSQLITFLNKYNKVNERITCEVLTEANNYEKIKENELQEGYFVLIFESGEAKKVVDASTEFSTYDYTTGQQIDITEQSVTNAIMSLLVENKPKIYFTEGHQEFALTQELNVLSSYLKNESFETTAINLATVEAIPEDCDILAIMSPKTDLYDIERDMILNYISKGGKIYYSTEPMASTVELPNIKTVLSQYGVSVQNGQIIEMATNRSVPSSPNVFKPQLSPSNAITQDIFSSNGEIWVAYSARLQFESEETLNSLNVVKEDLMTSSEESIFVTDLTTSFESAVETAEKGKSTVASMVTKTVTKAEGEDDQAKDLKSTLIISASGSYISDYRVQALSANYPLSYIGNNKDFAINCMANLANKEGLTIRKEITAATYIPTQTQKFVVNLIIFGVPACIIIAGIAVWAYRKKRK